jgi:hypothetical protein
MKVLFGVLMIGLVTGSLSMFSGCSTTGATTSRVHYGGGYRSYHDGPWGSYYPPVYIIDDGLDELDRPEAGQLPEFGPPDIEMGGMDGGFDAFDF